MHSRGLVKCFMRFCKTSCLILFLVALTSYHSFAQTSVRAIRLGTSSKGSGLKFIEDIEMTPGVPSLAAAVEKPSLKESAKIEKPVRSLSVSDKAGSTIEQMGSLQFKYAILMDRPVEELSNEALYKTIDEWYGTRYLYGGTGKGGIDCSAFCGKVYAGAFGITLPRTARDQYQAVDKVSREELKEGDLVFFNTRGGVSHVGVYLGNDCFVHSSTHQGVTISRMSDSYYKPRFLGAGRISRP